MQEWLLQLMYGHLIHDWLAIFGHQIDSRSAFRLTDQLRTKKSARGLQL